MLRLEILEQVLGQERLAEQTNEIPFIENKISG